MLRVPNLLTTPITKSSFARKTVIAVMFFCAPLIQRGSVLTIGFEGNDAFVPFVWMVEHLSFPSPTKDVERYTGIFPSSIRSLLPCTSKQRFESVFHPPFVRAGGLPRGNARATGTSSSS